MYVCVRLELIQKMYLLEEARISQSVFKCASYELDLSILMLIQETSKLPF